MSDTKNLAAQAMANLRWSKTSLEDRQKHNRKLQRARQKKLTQKQRSAIARKAGLARGKQKHDEAMKKAQ